MRAFTPLVISMFKADGPRHVHNPGSRGGIIYGYDRHGDPIYHPHHPRSMVKYRHVEDSGEEHHLLVTGDEANKLAEGKLHVLDPRNGDDAILDTKPRNAPRDLIAGCTSFEELYDGATTVVSQIREVLDRYNDTASSICEATGLSLDQLGPTLYVLRQLFKQKPLMRERKREKQKIPGAPSIELYDSRVTELEKLQDLSSNLAEFAEEVIKLGVVPTKYETEDGAIENPTHISIGQRGLELENVTTFKEFNRLLRHLSRAPKGEESLSSVFHEITRSIGLEEDDHEGLVNLAHIIESAPEASLKKALYEAFTLSGVLFRLGCNADDDERGYMQMSDKEYRVMSRLESRPIERLAAEVRNVVGTQSVGHTVTVGSKTIPRRAFDSAWGHSLVQALEGSGLKTFKLASSAIQGVAEEDIDNAFDALKMNTRSQLLQVEALLENEARVCMDVAKRTSPDISELEVGRLVRRTHEENTGEEVDADYLNSPDRRLVEKLVHTHVSTGSGLVLNTLWAVRGVLRRMDRKGQIYPSSVVGESAKETSERHERADRNSDRLYNPTMGKSVFMIDINAGLFKDMGASQQRAPRYKSPNTRMMLPKPKTPEATKAHEQYHAAMSEHLSYGSDHARTNPAVKTAARRVASHHASTPQAHLEMANHHTQMAKEHPPGSLSAEHHQVMAEAHTNSVKHSDQAKHLGPKYMNKSTPLVVDLSKAKPPKGWVAPKSPTLTSSQKAKLANKHGVGPSKQAAGRAQRMPKAPPPLTFDHKFEVHRTDHVFHPRHVKNPGSRGGVIFGYDKKGEPIYKQKFDPKEKGIEAHVYYPNTDSHVPVIVNGDQANKLQSGDLHLIHPQDGDNAIFDTKPAYHHAEVSDPAKEHKDRLRHDKKSDHFVKKYQEIKSALLEVADEGQEDQSFRDDVISMTNMLGHAIWDTKLRLTKREQENVGILNRCFQQWDNFLVDLERHSGSILFDPQRYGRGSITTLFSSVERIDEWKHMLPDALKDSASDLERVTKKIRQMLPLLQQGLKYFNKHVEHVDNARQASPEDHVFATLSNGAKLTIPEISPAWGWVPPSIHKDDVENYKTHARHSADHIGWGHPLRSIYKPEEGQDLDVNNYVPVEYHEDELPGKGPATTRKELHDGVQKYFAENCEGFGPSSHREAAAASRKYAQDLVYLNDSLRRNSESRHEDSDSENTRARGHDTHFLDEINGLLFMASMHDKRARELSQRGAGWVTGKDGKPEDRGTDRSLARFRSDPALYLSTKNEKLVFLQEDQLFGTWKNDPKLDFLRAPRVQKALVVDLQKAAKNHVVAGHKYLVRYKKIDGTWGYIYQDDHVDSEGNLKAPLHEIVKQAFYGHAKPVIKRRKYGPPDPETKERAVEETEKMDVVPGHFFDYHVSRKEERDWAEVKRGERTSARKPGWDVTPIRLQPGFTDIEIHEDFRVPMGKRQALYSGEIKEPKKGRKTKDSTKDHDRKISKEELAAEHDQIIYVEKGKSPFPRNFVGGSADIWPTLQRENPLTMAEFRDVVTRYTDSEFGFKGKKRNNVINLYMDTLIDNKCVQVVPGTLVVKDNKEWKEVNALRIKDKEHLAQIEADIAAAEEARKNRDAMRASPKGTPVVVAPDKALPGGIRGTVTPKDVSTTDPTLSANPLDFALGLLSVAAGTNAKMRKFPQWMVDKFGDLGELTDELKSRPATTALTLGHRASVAAAITMPQLWKEWDGILFNMAKKMAGFTEFSTRGDAVREKSEGFKRTKENPKSPYENYVSQVVRDLAQIGRDALTDTALEYTPTKDANQRFDKYAATIIKNKMIEASKKMGKLHGSYVPLGDEFDENETRAVLSAPEMGAMETAEYNRVAKPARRILKKIMSGLKPAYKRVLDARLWLDEGGEGEEKERHEHDIAEMGAPAAADKREQQDKNETWQRPWTGEDSIAEKYKHWVDPETNIKITMAGFSEKHQRRILQKFFERAVSKVREKLTDGHGNLTNDGDIVKRYLELQALLSSGKMRLADAGAPLQTVPASPLDTRHIHGPLVADKATSRGTITLKSFVRGESGDTLTKAMEHLDFVYAMQRVRKAA